ncbi:hypothetical protein [Bergeyella zoohelcum]|uniref:Uncharacterized protein n=1 Tax=Bergeyella zoohelcum TaxID=1015 RepID=A0A376C131_9FLAO|nr:hypothetical protein [Bergeyella zoohelcum]EKB60959.1 hypothetical protein HMPREF9700_00454 [Bergeyella zoohelcum CCUG 30536]SSZ46950.1 Uncharacterised protein [Bergeyella zoohelcum]
MDNIEQNSTGNNNLQVGVNNGQIIKTERVIRKIEVIRNDDEFITQEQALQIREKILEIGSALALDKKISN